MEIKINREIRDYHESMFMGLSLRQTLCSLLAVGAAVGLYFWLNPILGTEAVSWACMLGAAPFAALGFVSYHGMPAEKFLWVWFRSEILEPKVIRFQPTNLYYEIMKDTIAKLEKEASPVAFKSQFIMSLLKQVDPDGIGAHQKSIIDRCVAQVFREQKQTGGVPTICTVREKLLEQPEPEARGLALTMELYTSGSLDIFAHETNVDTQNRITSHDIHALSEDLKQPGFVTITDAMLNRVNRNWAQGRKTHVFIDEFHIAYENEYSGNFFTSAWRQFRKRNAAPCAITQNVEYLLDSIQASTMLSNSEFIVMLNQAESDQERLSRLLNISPEQMSYVNGAEAGCGLMRYGNALVPFVNRFPADTELYKLITTKPGEGMFAKGQVDFYA